MDKLSSKYRPLEPSALEEMVREADTDPKQTKLLRLIAMSSKEAQRSISSTGREDSSLDEEEDPPSINEIVLVSDDKKTKVFERRLSQQKVGSENRSSKKEQKEQKEEGLQQKQGSVPSEGVEYRSLMADENEDACDGSKRMESISQLELSEEEDSIEDVSLAEEEFLQFLQKNTRDQNSKKETPGEKEKEMKGPGKLLPRRAMRKSATTDVVSLSLDDTGSEEDILVSPPPTQEICLSEGESEGIDLFSESEDKVDSNIGSEDEEYDDQDNDEEEEFLDTNFHADGDDDEMQCSEEFDIVPIGSEEDIGGLGSEDDEDEYEIDEGRLRFLITKKFTPEGLKSILDVPKSDEKEQTKEGDKAEKERAKGRGEDKKKKKKKKNDKKVSKIANTSQFIRALYKTVSDTCLSDSLPVKFYVPPRGTISSENPACIFDLQGNLKRKSKGKETPAPSHGIEEEQRILAKLKSTGDQIYKLATSSPIAEKLVSDLHNYSTEVCLALEGVANLDSGIQTVLKEAFPVTNETPRSSLSKKVPENATRRRLKPTPASVIASQSRQFFKQQDKQLQSSIRRGICVNNPLKHLDSSLTVEDEADLENTKRKLYGQLTGRNAALAGAIRTKLENSIRSKEVSSSKFLLDFNIMTPVDFDAVGRDNKNPLWRFGYAVGKDKQKCAPKRVDNFDNSEFVAPMEIEDAEKLLPFLEMLEQRPAPAPPPAPASAPHPRKTKGSAISSSKKRPREVVEKNLVPSEPVVDSVSPTPKSKRKRSSVSSKSVTGGPKEENPKRGKKKDKHKKKRKHRHHANGDSKSSSKKELKGEKQKVDGGDVPPTIGSVIPKGEKASGFSVSIVWNELVEQSKSSCKLRIPLFNHTQGDCRVGFSILGYTSSHSSPFTLRKGSANLLKMCDRMLHKEDGLPVGLSQDQIDRLVASFSTDWPRARACMEEIAADMVCVSDITKKWKDTYSVHFLAFWQSVFQQNCSPGATQEEMPKMVIQESAKRSILEHPVCGFVPPNCLIVKDEAEENALEKDSPWSAPFVFPFKQEEYIFMMQTAKRCPFSNNPIRRTIEELLSKVPRDFSKKFGYLDPFETMKKENIEQPSSDISSLMAISSVPFSPIILTTFALAFPRMNLLKYKHVEI